MKKRILILNGSPKRDESDTMHLTRAFLAGLREVADAEETLLHVIDQHIEYCTGCFACKRNGGACIHEDDMANILREILSSDILLFSFPLYCYSMPAPLKALLDRTMPLSSMAMQKVGERYEHPCQHDFSQLKYVMICGCGFPNAKHNFEPVVMQFQQMFGEADSTILTVPESPMFNAPEAEPATKPYLELVRQAGREYAQTGAIAQETMDKLKIPMIPEDVYAAICNGEA
ncbi:MAG: flavodoxin family protein [Clostridia bacterium]|nr:flavodoxin family protein [Clostridia bacterium]